MNLFLTDLHLTRSARAELTGAGCDGVVEVIPHRLAAASAVTGRLITRAAPDVVVVLSRSSGDADDRLAVVYRLEAAGDVWIPDVITGHDGEAVRAAVAPAPPRPPGTEANHPHAARDARVSAAFAGGLAGALALLGPGRVVGVLAGDAAHDRLAGFARNMGERTATMYLRARLTRDGGAHVTASVRLADEIARRLKLTATQHARLAQVARSAAVRAGEIPAPLSDELAPEPATKTEAKRRLAGLEAALAGIARAEI